MDQLDLRAQPSHEIAVPPKNAKGISHLGIVSGRAAFLTEAVRRQEEASLHVFAGDVGTFKHLRLGASPTPKH